MRRERRRVDPTAEKQADGDVGQRVFGHDLRQQFAEAPSRLAHVGDPGLRARLPVALDLQSPGGPRERVRRGQPADSRVDRLRVWDVLVGEEVSKGGPVHVRASQLEQGLDLGSERQSIRDFTVEERLDSESVARREQPALTGVPDGEGEHATQFVHHLRAIALVQVQQHLSVAFRGEGTGQRLSELPEVVDLAVVDHRQVAPRSSAGGRPTTGRGSTGGCDPGTLRHCPTPRSRPAPGA